MHEAGKARWQTPAQVKEEYPSAEILCHHRVIFKIRGNHYRLIVVMNYSLQIAYIRFVGTHKEYDRIDAETI